jgi:hypothetical protein
MMKQDHASIYLFTVAMRGGPTTATFTIAELTGDRTVTVLNEERSLTAKSGTFNDAFAPWEVHLYRIGLRPSPSGTTDNSPGQAK